MLRYELNDKVYGLMKGLVSMCGVMGLRMYIELVDYDLGHEQGLIMIYAR